MKINIQSLHFTANQALEAYVQVKVEKLFHLNRHITSADVCLKLEHSDVQENKVCEIKMHIPGNDLFAKRQCKTFEEATNEATEALEKPLQKHKDQTLPA